MCVWLLVGVRLVAYNHQHLHHYPCLAHETAEAQQSHQLEHSHSIELCIAAEQGCKKRQWQDGEDVNNEHAAKVAHEDAAAMVLKSTPGAVVREISVRRVEGEKGGCYCYCYCCHCMNYVGTAVLSVTKMSTTKHQSMTVSKMV